MGILDITLTNPARGRAAADADERDSLDDLAPRLTAAQQVTRFAFTIAALVGLSALFASQIHATLQ